MPFIIYKTLHLLIMYKALQESVFVTFLIPPPSPCTCIPFTRATLTCYSSLRECRCSRILWLLTHRPRLVEQLFSGTLLVLKKREAYNTQLKCHMNKDNIERKRDGNSLIERDISCVENNKIYPGLRHGFDPWFRKILWRRKWQPTPIFLPEKSHGQRSLRAIACGIAGVRHD